VPRLDVPRELLQFVAKLLAAERPQAGHPRGSRALTCFWQAVAVLGWCRDGTTCDALARDHGISRATACQALERAEDDGFSHVVLGGKIIPCDRWKGPALSA